MCIVLMTGFGSKISVHNNLSYRPEMANGGLLLLFPVAFMLSIYLSSNVTEFNSLNSFNTVGLGANRLESFRILYSRHQKINKESIGRVGLQKREREIDTHVKRVIEVN